MAPCSDFERLLDAPIPLGARTWIGWKRVILEAALVPGAIRPRSSRGASERR